MTLTVINCSENTECIFTPVLLLHGGSVTAAAWTYHHHSLSPKGITVQLSNVQYKVIIVFWCTQTGKPLTKTLVYCLLQFTNPIYSAVHHAAEKIKPEETVASVYSD